MSAPSNPTPRLSEGRVLPTSCIACNASLNLCDCLKWNNGKRDGAACCALCDHLVAG